MELSMLKDIKVLDLTRVLAGPFCTLQLADLGAEVVKVEMPQKGDDSRFYGPFIDGHSAYFLSLNRNKKSLTLDLKSSRGKEIFKELVSGFDVLVENFRPGTMEKWGLGYEELEKINPRLIYTAISGFGNSGPDRLKPAYDIVVQGRGGIMSITGQEEDKVPTRVGASIGDITAGLFGVISILSAYIHAIKTGQGNKVDLSMLDCQVAILENAICRSVISGINPEPIGNRHPSITPFATLTASDGYIIVAAANQKLWEKLCYLTALDNLIGDPRFQDNDLRTKNWKELEPLLNRVFNKKTAGEWISLLESEGIPCGLVQNISQLLEDEQVLDRNMIRDIKVSAASDQTTRVAGIPYNFSTPTADRFTPAPELGQDSFAILQDYAGLNREECRHLRDEGII